MEKYFDTTIENLKIKTRIYYHLGGINYFTGNVEKRGYYLSVSPVTVETSGIYKIESFTAFSGTKVLLLECNRKSYKKEIEAQNISSEKMQELINYVKVKNNIQ